MDKMCMQIYAKLNLKYANEYVYYMQYLKKTWEKKCFIYKLLLLTTLHMFFF